MVVRAVGRPAAVAGLAAGVCEVPALVERAAAVPAAAAVDVLRMVDVFDAGSPGRTYLFETVELVRVAVPVPALVPCMVTAPAPERLIRVSVFTAAPALVAAAAPAPAAVAARLPVAISFWLPVVTVPLPFPAPPD